jgi:hypothetical protein
MTHKNCLEPVVVLPVILLRAPVPFELVSLCTYGTFRGNEIRGPTLLGLPKLGVATEVRSNRIGRADIIKK